MVKFFKIEQTQNPFNVEHENCIKARHDRGDRNTLGIGPRELKRPRNSTPPEQLQPDRDGRFCMDEERALESAMLADLSFHASSLSEDDSS